MNLHSAGRKSNRLIMSLLLIPILIMLLVSGLSCVSKGTYEKLASEHTATQSELTAANASLSSMTTERDKLSSQLTSTNASLSSITAERDSLNSQLNAANASLASMTADRDRLSTQLSAANASLSTMTADRDKLSTQLTTANASLASMTAERDSLNASLTAANTSLASIRAERDSLSSQLTAAKASLSTVTADRDRLNLQVTQLQGDYQKLYQTISQSNPSLRNPTWAELVYFLEQDDTNTKVYKADVFDCSGFAITLRDRALRYGFRSAYIEIAFVDDTAHAVTAFQTSDKGLVYVDDTGNESGTGKDCIGYVQVGKPYGAISLGGVKSQYIDAKGDPKTAWLPMYSTTDPNPFSYDYYENYQRRYQFFKDSVTAFNLAVTDYNSGGRTYSYSQLSAWDSNLDALWTDLGLPGYQPSKTVETIETYWD